MGALRIEESTMTGQPGTHNEAHWEMHFLIVCSGTNYDRLAQRAGTKGVDA